MKKAYVYLRVSSINQVDGHGFSRQIETCQHFADQHGIIIERFFKEEGVSGVLDETERPAFQEMIAAILNNGTKTVIVESLDRLARELRIQESLIVYLATKGIDLISARTQENITEAVKSDPLKKALIQIQGVFAELEKNQLVRRLQKAREHVKREKGKCEGRIPYGDTPEEQHVIRRIRALRRRRRDGSRLTLQAIADRLNREGVLTKDGKQWRPVQIHRLLSQKRPPRKSKPSF